MQNPNVTRIRLGRFSDILSFHLVLRLHGVGGRVDEKEGVIGDAGVDVLLVRRRLR